jgi:transposase
MERAGGDKMAIFKKVMTDIDYLFPKSIHDYLPDDHEAWVFHDIFKKIDISNITSQYSPGGKEANSPLSLLETIFYSSYQGIRSSRKIEKAIREQIPYKIFCGDEIIDFRRICEFKIRFKEEIKDIFVKILLIAGRLEMIDLNSLFIDGSVIKANARKDNCYKKEKLQEYQKKLQESIEKELSAGIQEDKKEDKAYGEDNPYLLSDELQNKKKRLARINEALNELEENGKDETNLTDKDAGKMKMKNGGYAAGYNVQLATTKDQIIMANDVTQLKSDAGAEEKVESEVKENIQKLQKLGDIEKPKGKIAVVKDSAYYRVNDLKKNEEDKDFEYYIAMQNKIAKNRKKVINNKGKALPEARGGEIPHPFLKIN